MFQSIAAFFTAIFLTIGGFFAGLPNTVNVWDKPSETITDTAKVLALYKDVATKNGDTWLLERLSADDLVDGNNALSVRLIEAWAKVGMYLINPRMYTGTQGLPGTPKALTKTDLKNAKAEYYHGGKTLVLTFDLPDQVDKLDGKSNNQSVARALGSVSDISFNSIKVQVGRLGYTLKSATMTYSNASVMVRVDVATGKVVKAKMQYHAVISAVRNESATAFSQSFDYNVKLP